jgi:hypothetical protein
MVLENIGDGIALNVLVGKATSWPEINWHMTSEIQSITANGGREIVEVGLVEPGTNGSILHRSLRQLLNTSRFAGRKPIEVTVSFSNVQGNRFTRTFILKKNGTAIQCYLGKLVSKRI